MHGKCFSKGQRLTMSVTTGRIHVEVLLTSGCIQVALNEERAGRLFERFTGICSPSAKPVVQILMDCNDGLWHSSSCG